MTITQKLKSMIGENSLKDFVINHYLDRYKEDEIKSQMEQLQEYGCQSGMISELIYYSDTEKFFEEHKETLNEMANELVQDCGYKSIFELIPKLDIEDQLFLESRNKNLMTWFGFEETSHKIYEEVFDNDIVYDKAEKVKIVYKEIGKQPIIMEIENTLEAKQELVGGLIEVVAYKEGMCLICNEEGKVYDMKANLNFENDYIAGNCFVIGDDYENGDFKSLTDKQIQKAIKDLNSRAFRYKDINYGVENKQNNKQRDCR